QEPPDTVNPIEGPKMRDGGRHHCHPPFRQLPSYAVAHALSAEVPASVPPRSSAGTASGTVTGLSVPRNVSLEFSRSAGSPSQSTRTIWPGRKIGRAHV